MKVLSLVVSWQEEVVGRAGLAPEFLGFCCDLGAPPLLGGAPLNSFKGVYGSPSRGKF